MLNTRTQLKRGVMKKWNMMMIILHKLKRGGCMVELSKGGLFLYILGNSYIKIHFLVFNGIFEIYFHNEL
jgi:hypothetical protein